ncbi:MAG: DsbA family protein [Rhodobacteraceae bacterium]|nr:DsbA family protein [Paracoccaceae bacterium]
MIRTVTAATLSLGLALPAAAFDIDAMTDAERAAFRAEIRAYLLDNPEVIFEAVDVFEARKAEAEATDDLALVAAYSDEIFDDGHSWVGGNPDGDVTMVEFVDYRCGYCRRAYNDVEALINGDGNIRLVVKEFPILGENSVSSSRFAIASRLVGGDDAYKAAHDALIAFSGEMTEPAVRRLSDSLGFDTEAVIETMSSDAVTDVIMANRDLAQKMRINGTPTFIVGDQMLRGYVPLPGMKQLIDQIRADG